MIAVAFIGLISMFLSIVFGIGCLFGYRFGLPLFVAAVVFLICLIIQSSENISVCESKGGEMIRGVCVNKNAIIEIH